jgi:ribosome biogenesis GTPase
MAVNQDFNLRRLERYLAVAYGAQITPIILLTKVDLCQSIDQYKNMIWKENPQVEIMECSVEQEIGLEAIKNKIKQDETAVFIGSSGVGKSTLVNRLMEENVLKTNTIREDDGKGRHTTTHRQLLMLPGGGTVIDTPGMRELALDDSDVSDTFEDIEELSTQCKFRNCSHNTEPGCAVKIAIDNGSLPYKRYKNYTKLLLEELNRQKRKKKSPY